MKRPNQTCLLEASYAIFRAALPGDHPSVFCLQLSFRRLEQKSLPAEIVDYYKGFLRFKDLEYYCKHLAISVRIQKKRAICLKVLGKCNFLHPCRAALAMIGLTSVAAHMWIRESGARSCRSTSHDMASTPSALHPSAKTTQVCSYPSASHQTCTSVYAIACARHHTCFARTCATTMQV